MAALFTAYLIFGFMWLVVFSTVALAFSGTGDEADDPFRFAARCVLSTPIWPIVGCVLSFRGMAALIRAADLRLPKW